MNSQPSAGENPDRGVSRDYSKLILSVDDEPNILYTREKILEAQGYEVLSALDGEGALKLFHSYPVELVLLDFAMPGMDGGEVAREMKMRRPSVPIFMISAQEAALSKARCPFVDLFIPKGDGPLYWLEQVQQVFAARSAFRRRA